MNDRELIGKVPYLERVCTMNLRKLSLALHQMRSYAQKTGLHPSFTCYKRWGMKKRNGQGHKPVVRLRFSRSGDETVERWYATHFVDKKRIAQIREQRRETISPENAPDEQS